jgi:predicted ATP-grasp superfamily ATP-dependent carboligase
VKKRAKGASPSPPEVLIVSSHRGTVTMRLPGILKRAGFRVSLLSFEKSLALCSRHIAQHIPVAQPEDWATVQALRQHLESCPGFYAWIIIGDDAIFHELAAQSDQSWLDWFPVSLAARGAEMCSSKAAFVSLCEELGISTPASRVCHDLAQVQAAAQELGYPCLLKKAFATAGNGVRRVDNLAALEPNSKQLADEHPLVVQTFLEGLPGSTAILFDHGIPIAWISAYMHHCWPTPFSPSCQWRFMHHSDIEPICHKLGERLGFHGFCGLDWIHLPADNSLHVLEFNPRPIPMLHLGPLCGVDFGQGAMAMHQGRSFVQPPQSELVGDRVVYMFPQDLYRSLKKSNWHDLRHWLPGAALHDIPWDEPRMASLMLWSAVKRGFRSIRHA